ncbi:MAG: helix-turn-helix transcriptional regulator [Methylococcaceae bacterium]|nr:helix-turn-helix transcriptional regulator [Methylococcaceae bacterium]
MPKLLCHRDSSPCPLAHALDIVGDRWTLLIVRDLMLRNLHEYKDILNSFEGISTNILADRLRRLTEAGLVRCVPHPRSGTRKLYYLSASGKDLIHSLLEITLWSSRQLGSARLPPELAQRLEADREGFIHGVLEQLDRWEAENLG